MKYLNYKPSLKYKNNIQVCLPFIQSLINMESVTIIYKNRNELHTQPTRMQFHTLQSYTPGSSTFHPSASSRTNLAQHGQKSTCTGPEIIFSNKTLSIIILSKTYPTSGYNLAHVSRHARLSGW